MMHRVSFPKVQHVKPTAMIVGIIPDEMDRAVAGVEGGPERQPDRRSPLLGQLGPLSPELRDIGGDLKEDPSASR